MPGNNRIYVCQSGTCRRKGSDATLIEIEELAKLVGDCDVRTTGCLGYCRRGPAVEVVTKQRRSSEQVKRTYHVKVDTFRKAASVIKYATGREPPDLDNLPPETEARLSDVRATKKREYFSLTYQWNKALSGLNENLIRQDRNLRRTLEDILEKAGYPGMYLRDLLMQQQQLPSSSSTSTKRGGTQPLLEMPTSIEGYVSWQLQSVKIVSGHSAVFQFATEDLKRGTPHPRGRSKMAQPITWHVTMLGEVGSNAEGPLPWIERDYTPISSALEWERGRCDILIKIYNDGILSKWLQQRTWERGNETKVFLSKPVRTLSVPALVADDDDGFRPKSVLLLLAGTGIVALPQILAHREPSRLLGVSTPGYKQLRCPIDLIHSCREDDLLLLPEIKQYCLDGMKPHPRLFRGLRNYTLLVTGNEKRGQGDDDEHSGSSSGLPFQEHFNKNGTVDHDAILKDVPNAKTLKCRLDYRIIEDAIERLVYPYRVVVSGPDAFNNAAREMLDEFGLKSDQVTLLSA